MSPPTRLLGPGDEPAVETFLRPHVDSSLFLLGNLRAAGIVDTGAAYSATWVASFEGPSITGVAAHCWNGVLLLQAPAGLPALSRATLEASGRSLAGISGPRGQVDEARAALGLNGVATTMDHEAELFSVAFGELAVPESLLLGRTTCSPPRSDELPLLADWRVAYAVETLGAVASPDLAKACAGEIDRLVDEGNAFVLREEGTAVAFSGFNARLEDVVQVGGVYTPPSLRGRGFGRAVVAGSLLSARAEGVRRAVLFTERENGAARRAYLALGFRVVGDYGMVFFETPARAVR